MSSNTSASPPPIEILVDAPMTSKTTKAKKATTKKVTSKSGVKSSHPSWKEIVKACILVNKENSRSGVSRSTIKKYAEETYDLDVSATNLYQLNRAIASGVEGGIFVLPKGPSGKVKLTPKTKPVAESTKENSKPASVKKAATATKKAPVSKRVNPTAVAPKKATTDKKASTAAKKTATPTATRGSATKKVVAGASAKKPVKSAPAKKGSTKSTDKKRVAAKEAAKKPRSRAKLASKKVAA